MVKLDVYGGLLGAGKTTLIKQMLSAAYAGHRTAIIENEIGKVNLDAEELKTASVSIREISSGCICCTVRGSFSEAVKLLVREEDPEYIVVEPSGAADLPDVARACMNSEIVSLNRIIMVVNGRKLRRLLSVVGPFYLEQLKNARMIYLNFTEGMSRDEIEETKTALWEVNQDLTIVETPLDEISGDTFQEGNVKVEKYIKRTSGSMYVAEGSDRKDRIVMMRPDRKQELTSWYYNFHNSFSDHALRKIIEILRQEPCADIWRVKGYLKMDNGEIRKVDMEFGDSYLQ